MLAKYRSTQSMTIPEASDKTQFYRFYDISRKIFNGTTHFREWKTFQKTVIAIFFPILNKSQHV